MISLLKSQNHPGLVVTKLRVDQVRSVAACSPSILIKLVEARAAAEAAELGEKPAQPNQ